MLVSGRHIPAVTRPALTTVTTNTAVEVVRVAEITPQLRNTTTRSGYEGVLTLTLMLY